MRWILVGLIANVAAGQGVSPVSVPDEPSCLRCTITTRPLATLGGDGPGSLVGIPSGVRETSKGYWVLPFDGGPMLYSSAGRYLRTIGTIGKGPGEFVGNTDVLALANDSMIIIDRRGMRASLYSGDFKLARTISVPWEIGTVASLGGRELLESGIIPAPNSSGLPLHRISLEGNEAKLLRSFGPETVTFSGRMMDALARTWRLYPGREGQFWTADVASYRVIQWNAQQVPVTVLTRSPSWFVSPSRMTSGGPEVPPNPRLIDLSVDADGMVWTFVAVPSPNWKAAWHVAAADLARSKPADRAGKLADVEDLYHVMIEVLDPRANRVVARTTLPAFAICALPGRRVVTYALDGNGSPSVVVHQLTLTRP